MIKFLKNNFYVLEVIFQLLWAVFIVYLSIHSYQQYKKIEALTIEIRTINDADQFINHSEIKP
jgi:cell division protein FtsL